MPDDFVLVRVNRELAERLANDDSEPVVVVGIQHQEDGAADMVFKAPTREQLTEALDAR